jgi:hypothetical protein
MGVLGASCRCRGGSGSAARLPAAALPQQAKRLGQLLCQLLPVQHQLGAPVQPVEEALGLVRLGARARLLYRQPQNLYMLVLKRVHEAGLTLWQYIHQRCTAQAPASTYFALLPKHCHNCSASAPTGAAWCIAAALLAGRNSQDADSDAATMGTAEC